MNDPSSHPDPITALSQITDDTAGQLEIARWAQEQLLAGQSPEELVEEMVCHGWEPAHAEQITETARRETRAQRGVITRDDVVRDLNVDYRRATGGLSVAFRSGLFGLYGFTTGFMSALRSLRKLKAVVTRSKK